LDTNTIYIAEGDHPHGTLTGVEIGDPSIGFATKAKKIWDVCNALGNIAFAYSFSMILIEIQVWCRILPKPLYLSSQTTKIYTF
jgi:hypothetical protein